MGRGGYGAGRRKGGEEMSDKTPTHTQRADGLTHKQEAAIIALLNEPTVQRAAKVCGLNDRTIYRWLDEPVFSRAYRKARREAFAQAIAASQRYAPVAVQTLAKIMTDGTLSVSARVSAATALLKFSRESIELDDLATRVDDLERSMKEASERSPEPPHANWGDRSCA